ncbi:pyridoxal phosphate-dependent aminotransferase family protein [Aurantibacter crassamenti]|uniref:aminotransferase class I/II-fold pyridoxal phosphate-dependent enzyme n=1 Tax=Aurantibacter crassamenti TaxID=1837375 RepID=UPI00193AAE3C|nr:aminotransferase class I/II-fold pyridoxal phosphate-dependent enzyme [Aurantibacter crassamenti]MBM1107689.1 pyridoxal phosphate-dependent aminotransferase family protein [Aurantibacter crassamenti]
MIHEVAEFPDRIIIIDGEEYLYFGGTAYLGLQTDSSFQEIFIKNVRKFGTNYGASRNANVRLTIYEKAEKYLAEQISSEACLTLSSGFLTGQLIAKHFHSQNKHCYYAPGTHEALHLLGTKNHTDFKNLISDLNTALENENINPILFLDSVLMNGKNHPEFNWLNKINLEKITLVVDDSHGFGIVGKKGNGIYETLIKLKPKELIVCGSLGKGFGVQAGFIAGSNKLINKLRLTNMYAAASPASAAAMATLVESHEIITAKRDLLFKNNKYFISNLEHISLFNYLPDYPCFSFNNERLSEYLKANKIIVTNFYYPTEKDNLVQRIVISAHHKKSDIKKLADAINHYF